MLFYFRRDVWEISRLHLPEERTGYDVPDLDFSKINNSYNKLMLKKFIGEQIIVRELTMKVIYHKLLKISRFLCWLDEKDIRDVTFADADDYSSYLGSGNLSDNVYNEHIFTLREFFGYINAHTSVDNHFKELGCRKLYPKQPREVDHEMVLEILSKLEELPLNIRIMFFILYAGLPIHIMLRLKRDCLEQDKDIYKLRFYNPNRERYDHIEISKNLYRLIEKYNENQKVSSIYLFPYSRDHARAETYTNLREYLVEVRGDNDFILSDFRKAFLFRLFYHGVPLLTIRLIVKLKSFSALNEKYKKYKNSDFEQISNAINNKFRYYNTTTT